MIRHLFLLAILGVFLATCQSLSTPSADEADTILLNANVYTVNEKMPTADAIAIKGNRIVAVGDKSHVLNWKGDSTKVEDMGRKFVMPGFIEGHGHFSGLGYSLLNLNFLKSQNWDEIVEMVAAAAQQAKPGEWIEGRGWHQEKWDTIPENSVHGYPFHQRLSEVSPDNPVMLIHASGHALFANEAAMKTAGITIETPAPEGGEIVRNIDGEAIGVFEERAMSLIRAQHEAWLSTLPEAARFERWKQAIALAETACLRNGITSFQDAGSKMDEIHHYEALAAAGELDVRLWVMVRERYEDLKDISLQEYPKIGLGGDFLTIRAIKSEVDGALGAFGAWLLRPYHDKPGFTGQNTTPITDVKHIAEIAAERNMQMCVHAIGDRANRVTLNIYQETFEELEQPEDLRWRIEHAQHLDTADIPRFREMGVIASMQGVHCTSDAPFVEKRLGEFRSRTGAYPWRSLLDAGVIIANGTDAPVEDVSPIASYYASVTRKRADNDFAFFPEQRMTRAEAIYSYTLGNAYAAFEEQLKGSIEPGKLADLVVLSNDLLTCPEDEILNTTIEKVFVGGQAK